ncbi:MAG: alpha/beta fold hydrolase [Hyphomonadaceae bacterium]|nr:alpha/beta fold hydrolase [Hyphomonadaceae bacterium]
MPTEARAGRLRVHARKQADTSHCTRLGILAAGLLMVASCVSVEFSEAEMFRPRPGPSLTTEAVEAAGYQFEPLDITAPDGVHLRGGLLKKPGAAFTIVFYGGNIATAARTGIRRARELALLNANLVLVDYRSYGGSDVGPMSSEAFLQDGLTVFDHVAARQDLVGQAIVVHGHSMGSLIAGHVAANRQTAGVVLESSATTTQAFADNQVPWYGRPFVRVDVEDSLRDQGNLPIMSRIEEPLLLIVGANDRDTPPAFSRQLYETSSLPEDRRRLAIVEDAGHSDVFARPEAIDAYSQFLTSLARTASSP